MYTFTITAKDILGQSLFFPNTYLSEEGNQSAFIFKLMELHSKSFPRLVIESCFIHTKKAARPMNSKAEWHQPVVARVVVTRELEELSQEAGGSGGGQGRARGRGRPRRGEA